MNKPKFQLALSMIIFGTIGLIRRFIPLSSAVLACVRGLIGTGFLLLYMLASKKKPDLASIKKNAPLTVLSGVMIGFNWILLFEAYNYTSVAVATLCYYMQPVFVILASPFVMKEKLTGKKALCTAAALFGMVLVSGALKSGIGPGEGKGILLGLGAALLYATTIMMNKFITGISPIDRTVIQLFSAGVVTIPYILATEGFPDFRIGAAGIILTLVAGLIHTGIAYVLYFGSMEFIPVQSIAIMSYLDPVVALLLSVFVLREPFGIAELIGAFLILGAGYFAEKH